jgi:chromate reductase
MSEDVAVIVGSLRRAAFSRKTARTLIELAPPPLSLEIIEIGQLPLYNEDLEVSPPPEWTQFRDRIRRANGVLFVTPEYNRSMPGGLKNALDVASRPYGQSAWNGKPAGVVSVSPGAIGGFGANHHLRQSLVFLNMPVLQQPEVYLGNAAQLFDEDGNLTNESTRRFLRGFLETLAAWIAAVTRTAVATGGSR